MTVSPNSLSNFVWHLSLCELQAGNWAEALRLYQDAMTLDRHSGGPQQKMSYATAFCGVPNSPAIRATPPPGVRCTSMRTARYRDRVAGSPTCPSFCYRRSGDAALDVRARQMEDLAREERYVSGSYLPALSRGGLAFERADFPPAIEVRAPLAKDGERIGGIAACSITRSSSPC
jgi:hypothetical protein